jgi:hypothetical protein
MSYSKTGDWLGLNRFYTTPFWSFVQEWGPLRLRKKNDCFTKSEDLTKHHHHYYYCCFEELPPQFIKTVLIFR